jgi:hypothetical protein
MLAKQLEYPGEAEIVGIVLGARVPIIPDEPRRQDPGPARVLRNGVAAGAPR